VPGGDLSAANIEVQYEGQATADCTERGCDRVTAFANPAIQIGDGLVVECYGNPSDHSSSTTIRPGQLKARSDSHGRD